MSRFALLVAAVCPTSPLFAGDDAGAAAPAKLVTPAPAPAPTAPLKIRVPNTTVELELVQVPGPPSADGKPTKPIWVGRTEVTWDLYDVFVYHLDDPSAVSTGADATARPSKPYVPPDRGFGHNGFPAMGMTFHGAKAFCTWLSEKTGRTFRLPTEAEWEHFTIASGADPFAATADDTARTQRSDQAWFADNSDATTKPVATRRPNAFGLFDTHGNVAEWVTIDDGGKPLAKGGSFRDPPEQLAASVDLRQTSAWNASDPQIPRSTWWLADCSFVGFRVVMEEAENLGR